MSQIDKEKYSQSISKLDSIFREISSNVTEISLSLPIDIPTLEFIKELN